MQFQKIIVFLLLLALSASVAEEESKIDDKLNGYNDGNHPADQINSGLDEGQADDQGLGNGYDTGVSHFAPIFLGASVHKHITVTKKVGIPVPQPYPVTVEKRIPIAVPYKIAVPIDKPVPVPVPKPYPVTVEKPVPYAVEKQVPYPVHVKVPVKVKVPIAVPVPKPYPVAIHKPVAFPLPHAVFIKKPVPVILKDHEDEQTAGLSFDEHSLVFNGHSYNTEYTTDFKQIS